MLKLTMSAAAALLALASAAPASAQQVHNMPGMDMDRMMRQCAQMRQQMRPGATTSPQLMTMKQQCDQMDREMGGPAQAPAASTAPRVRTR